MRALTSRRLNSSHGGTLGNFHIAVIATYSNVRQEAAAYTSSLMLKRRHLILGLAVLSVVRPAWSHSYKLGAIAIGHAWALPSDGTDTEVCFPLSNTGKEPDELVEATSPIASKVEFRASADYSG